MSLHKLPNGEKVEFVREKDVLPVSQPMAENRFTECTAPLYNALTTSYRKISASIIIRQFC